MILRYGGFTGEISTLLYFHNLLYNCPRGVMRMPFVPKKTKEKVKAGYKTIYLRQSVIDALEQMARDNSTSFNNVVVSMIDYVNEVRTMPDWKEMYLTLFRETEKAIHILIEAQRRCEEMYIDAPEPEIKLLSPEDGPGSQDQKNSQA